VSSFLIVEAALLLGPAIAFVLLARVSPTLKKRLIVTSAACVFVLAVGGSLGFRLAPRPLGAIAFAVGMAAFWVVIWGGRPKPEATWRLKGPYWIGASAILLLNYFSATAGVLGVGFTTEASRPDARERLTPTVAVYAFRVGGPGIDFSGYGVQVRRTIPVIGLVEYVSQRRGYEKTAPGEMIPPTFTLSNREGAIEILVSVGEWAGEASLAPDTIRLD